MARVFLFVGAVSAGRAMLLGGIRAHVLHGRIQSQRLVMFDVGTHYQLVHAIAIVLLRFCRWWAAPRRC